MYEVLSTRQPHVPLIRTLCRLTYPPGDGQTPQSMAGRAHWPAHLAVVEVGYPVTTAASPGRQAVVTPSRQGRRTRPSAISQAGMPQACASLHWATISGCSMLASGMRRTRGWISASATPASSRSGAGAAEERSPGGRAPRRRKRRCSSRPRRTRSASAPSRQVERQVGVGLGR